MGWGILGDAVDAVGDAVSDTVDAVGDAASAVADTVGDGLSSAWHWTQDHWKEIAVIAVAVAVGVAVTLATGGLGAPLLLAAGAGGLAAGGAGYTVDRWLNDEPWRFGEFAKAAVVSGALAVATAGVAEVASPIVGPIVSRVVPTAVSEAVPTVVATTVRNATAGAVLGAGTQVATNAVTGRPLGENVGTATITGGVTAAVVAPIVEAVVPPRAPPVEEVVVPARPSDTKGLIGALDGEVAPAAAVPPPPSPEVVARGAGARPGGDPVGYGGVEPLSPIVGESRTAIDSWNAQVAAVRRSEPLVLTDAELAALERGRGAPSNTILAGDMADVNNFNQASRVVNEYVRSGQDLSIERIAEINRTLLSGTSNDTHAGVYRTTEQVGHGAADTTTGFFEYANPAHVRSYLDDFLTWYRANEGVLPPSELAAESYQQLVRIHPFVDSNGRTTRFVMDWILQRNGLPPATWTTANSEAVHASTDWLVYNVDRAVLDSASVLTTTAASTSDTSAQPGIVIPFAPPSPYSEALPLPAPRRTGAR